MCISLSLSIYIYIYNYYVYRDIWYIEYVSYVCCRLLVLLLFRCFIAMADRVSRCSGAAADLDRRRLNGYFAQQAPSLCLASSFRKGLNREGLQGMFPWRTRYPLS